MLVFWAVEPPGSTAQSNLADQNIRSAIRHEQHKLDFILRVNIYLLPLKTELLPQRRAIRSSVVAQNTATHARHMRLMAFSSALFAIASGSARGFFIIPRDRFPYLNTAFST